MLETIQERAAVAEPAAQVTVREAVIRLLRDLGMTTIFGNPGSTELGLFLDFPADFRYVLGLQESVAVGMADGYAQATHRAAFVNLHAAVGVGHAMGAIFTAFRNRTPLVITAGQQSRSILPYDPFLFSSQATELPKPYVKWSIEPARAEDVPQAIARAYYMAMQPPCGPVLVSVPADDWARTCDPVAVRQVAHSVRPDPTVLDLIGAQLDAAQRPAFVLGSPVDRDGAWDDVVALAERHQASVWIAPMSGRNGFPEDHPLFAGFLPAAREPIVDLLGGHDFVLALGAAAFTYHVEGSGPHLPAGCQLAQIVDDPNTIAWAPVGTAAVGSVRLSVRDLLARSAPLSARTLPPPRRPAPLAGASTPMTVEYVLQTLAQVRARDSVIVEETPSSRPIMQRYLPIYLPETFYTMDSGGLGFGLPAAVGVALARPDKKVIGLIGDGSSMYSIQGLWNAAQLDLPITFLILKNRSYAALRMFSPVYGFSLQDTLQGTALPGIDFVGLAKSLGCDALNVSDPAQLAQVLRSALAARRPTLVEIDVA